MEEFFHLVRSHDENADERLSAAPSPTDRAFVATRHGVLSWPTPFDLNLITG